MNFEKACYPTTILTIDQAITTISPDNTGGTASSYQITPTLPTGLIFNLQTGEITGTPQVLLVTSTFTIEASNTNPISSQTTLQLTVNDIPPTMTEYSIQNPVYIIGKTITENTVTFGGGAITNLTCNPAIPSGLTLDMTTGTISGTPDQTNATTMNNTEKEYTITASNSGGTVSKKITMTIYTQDQKDDVDYIALIQLIQLQLTLATTINTLINSITTSQTSEEVNVIINQIFDAILLDANFSQSSNSHKRELMEFTIRRLLRKRSVTDFTPWTNGKNGLLQFIPITTDNLKYIRNEIIFATNTASINVDMHNSTVYAPLRDTEQITIVDNRRANSETQNIEPFAVNGYFPLYKTEQAAIDASNATIPGAHSHGPSHLGGTESFYMPNANSSNNELKIYHGSYGKAIISRIAGKYNAVIEGVSQNIIDDLGNAVDEEGQTFKYVSSDNLYSMVLVWG